MLTALASWFSRRSVIIWACYFALLEVISWGTAGGPICLLDINGGGSEQDQNDQNYCPTFHVGLLRLWLYFVELVDRRHDAFTAAATIIIAIFTFTLWRATSRLWTSGERQLAATSKSVDLAQQEFETTLRARVSITNCKITRGITVGDRTKIGFTFRLENTGQLPATECSLTYTTKGSVDKEFKPRKDEELFGQDRQAHIVIASKEVSERHSEALDDFSPGVYERANATQQMDRERIDRPEGSRGVYLWVGITFIYMDGFNNERASWKWFEWRDGDFRECASRQD